MTSLIRLPTNSREDMTHRILDPWHPLLLRGQEVILPNLQHQGGDVLYFVFCHETGGNIATPVMMMMMAMMMMMTMMRKLVKFFHFLFQILMLYLVSILKEAEVQESVRKTQCNV